jgi:hypothetical protein
MTNDVPILLLKRPTNESLRSRECLSPNEVERLSEVREVTHLPRPLYYYCVHNHSIFGVQHQV